MEKKTLNFLNKVFIIISSVAIVTFALVFAFIYLHSKKIYNQNISIQNSADIKSYHIIVTGTYENKLFMEQVFQGAASLADSYNALVELYVPQSEAESEPLQNLLDYCSFVNADGVIAYIDNADKKLNLRPRIDDTEIPLVTTGQYSPNIHQISFIGNNYWELGKKIADEIIHLLENGGKAYIISEAIPANTNYSNLLTSLQNSLHNHEGTEAEIIEKIGQDFDFQEGASLFVCLTEEETLKTAQTLSEFYDDKKYSLIGFGNNETCQLYLQKGIIYELISLNPENIGETAIKEMFEYRNKGYANSYISADLKISKAEK